MVATVITIYTNTTPESSIAALALGAQVSVPETGAEVQLMSAKSTSTLRQPATKPGLAFATGPI